MATFALKKSSGPLIEDILNKQASRFLRLKKIGKEFITKSSRKKVSQPKK